MMGVDHEVMVIAIMHISCETLSLTTNSAWNRHEVRLSCGGDHHMMMTVMRIAVIFT